MTHKNLLFALALLFSAIGVSAQQELRLSLDEAIAQGLKHNYSLQQAGIEVESARQKVRETTATGLPQANANISYNDNVSLPTTLLPGAFLGQDEPVAVRFGTRYSSTAGLTLNQLLFSGSYIVALQSSQAFLRQSEKNLVKTRIGVTKNIKDAYALVLATYENLRVIDSTLSITRDLARQTRIIVETGFGEETDLDQLLLMVDELETARNNVLSQVKIAENLLKFHLGIDPQTPVHLTDKLDDLVARFASEQLISQEFMINENIDYQLLKNQEQLAGLQLKLQKSAYLPTLSAFFNAQTNAQRPEWDFFDSKGRWYFSSVWGLSLNIPLWSSGERAARVRQAQLQLDAMKVAEASLRNNLGLQFQTSQNAFGNALRTTENTRRNKATAEKIYYRTSVKYTEGLASSLDVLNTHNQYLNAQTQYINATLDLLNKATELETLLAKP
ncbi:MAG: TolC family protein [Bacteroidetes bacterium]|nr:TolC family protein [Bacteroidota bacterium]